MHPPPLVQVLYGYSSEERLSPEEFRILVENFTSLEPERIIEEWMRAVWLDR